MKLSFVDGETGMDEEFTGAFPRYSGAISAITEGPPEDINEMPACHDPASEGPIYDGSDLDIRSSHSSASRPRFRSRAAPLKKESEGF